MPEENQTTATTDATTTPPTEEAVRVTPEETTPSVDKTPDDVITPNPDETAETDKTQPVKLAPAYMTHFDHYIDRVKYNDEEMSIKYLNNCIKTMLTVKTNAAFNDVRNAFKKNKDLLTPDRTLQGIATLTPRDRAVVEIITTIFHILNNTNKTEKSVNLDMVRTVVKEEAFINWCAKKLA